MPAQKTEWLWLNPEAVIFLLIFGILKFISFITVY